MIGIIPSATHTFEVFGKLSDDNFVNGKLYYDEKDYRLYMYSDNIKRSNPSTGYFPIWDGKNKFITKFSNEKYFDKDAIKTDISGMASTIDKETANIVLYKQRVSDNDSILAPAISDEDNMFTQCIKGTITVKNLTIVDLSDMAYPHLNPKQVANYYSALTKIAFMRIDKWLVWLDIILHIHYDLRIFKNEKQIILYNYKTNEFDTGIIKYNSIVNSKSMDPFKKIIKILMIMENISKTSLHTDDVDDYTINNMITTINGSKPLSAQLFSRFIRMANLNYSIRIYDNADNKMIFEYHE